MNLKIRLSNPNAKKPFRESNFTAAYRLYSNEPTKVVLRHGESAVIKTGVGIKLPEGFAGMVTGLRYSQLLAHPCCIDPENWQEIEVAVTNPTFEQMVIQPGEPVAGIVFTMYCNVEFTEDKK